MYTKKFAHCILYVAAEDWKQPESSLIGYYVSKLCFIHPVECCMTLTKEIGCFTKMLRICFKVCGEKKIVTRDSIGTTGKIFILTIY